MAYGVIICTRCRQHAQIIQVGCSKTTRCQRCNANLVTRKLRVFFSSEELEEAISVRTQIQAQVTEGKNNFILNSKGNKESPEEGYHVFGDDIDERSACLISDIKPEIKKRPDELITGILLENNKKMNIGELKKKAISHDIREEQFNDILEKMLAAGDIYCPSKDIIKLI